MKKLCFLLLIPLFSVTSCKPKTPSLPHSDSGVLASQGYGGAVNAGYSSVEFNTSHDGTNFHANMGPRFDKGIAGGIVCDNDFPPNIDTQAEKEAWIKSGYKNSKYRTNKNFTIWYVAPSDTLVKMLYGGNEDCGQRINGHEPECNAFLKRGLCGKRLRISLSNDKAHLIGKRNLLDATNVINPGFRDPKALGPKKLAEMVKKSILEKRGFPNKVPKSVIVIINDFCPFYHSENDKPDGHCRQDPQIDLGPGPLLTLIPSVSEKEGGFVNQGNYLPDSRRIRLKVERAPDNEPLGPKY